MNDSLLNVKNLSIGFGEDVNVVKNISFTVPMGKTIGIVGESGSGKSITSLAIMQLLPVKGKITSGEISYNLKGDTIDIASQSNTQMQKIRGNEIAMIFQEPMTSLNPVFTCGYQVMEMILAHQKISKSDAKAKTIALFNEVKLPRAESIFNQYPHQLSGGQKQRVMIAMALSCDPKLLIADEPTTALDVTVQKTILELLKEMQKEREMSILFITHDLGVIYELANEVIVMNSGEIVEQGATQQVFHHPKHPYTMGLIACKPPLEVRYSKLPTVKDFLSLDKTSETWKNDFLSGITLTKESRIQAHQKLYAQTPLLSVKNIKTYFPNKKNWLGKITEYVKAVDDVTFDVYPGETLGLIGESGCGKTTIGRTILRLNKAESGEVLYNGKDVLGMNKEELLSFRKEVQIIFQDPYSSLNPRKSIGEAILEPIKVHQLITDPKEARERVFYLLEKVGLSRADYQKYPHQFSGGQRQRISIARTLALDPKFIVCDESVSALDVSVQAQVLNLLNELKAEFNLTYIFISHDLSVIKYMCDRMIVMNQNGKIEEQGDCDLIYQNPQSDYTKKLINAIPMIG
jgi:peptide/nickel transport system ATP-binding protein